MTNKILELIHLKKSYHDETGEIEAINDITIDVLEKELLVIVGPSGCGKSTILSILAGVSKESSGKINFIKDNLKIGYMLQKDCLFPWRTILDNCLIGLEINNESNEENKKRVIKLLTTYGLSEFIFKYPHSLSGGMRQRVALIRTLATNPDIILLDEAFSALDFQSRIILASDVYHIIKKEQKTAIIVTHDIAEGINC
ncbi:MAG: ATP-binding cassette domain-containing protein, partial [Bacilli bacterium]